ncbi:MAG: OmpA family protein [Gammaproteobacteria bacterium]|nr:OmpA family protein [Gammaproteobacteria bacterium]
MLKKCIACLVILFVLVACGPTQPTSELSAAQEAQLRREALITATAKKLQDAGVTIIHSGQESMLVLPADKFFFMDSSHLNGSYYGTLNAVSNYISLFDVEMVKVGGYSDNCGDPLRAVALSRQQAQNIASYLKNQGVKAPIIYAIGYGCTFPIADNSRADGRAMNRRIQITFYRLDAKR